MTSLKCELCKKKIQIDIKPYYKGTMTCPKMEIINDSLKKIFFKKHGATINYCNDHSNVEIMQDMIQNHQEHINKELIKKYSKVICQKDLENILINIS